MGGTTNYNLTNAACAQNQVQGDSRAPEIILSEMLRKDLGVEINPQALRMFLRSRWDRVSKFAHKIHDA